MDGLREYLRKLGRKVTIEVKEIAYETESGILIEWNQQNAWLPKKRVEISQHGESITLRLPRWLYLLKF